MRSERTFRAHTHDFTNTTPRRLGRRLLWQCSAWPPWIPGPSNAAIPGSDISCTAWRRHQAANAWRLDRWATSQALRQPDFRSSFENIQSGQRQLRAIHLDLCRTLKTWKSAWATAQSPKATANAPTGSAAVVSSHDDRSFNDMTCPPKVGYTSDFREFLLIRLGFLDSIDVSDRTEPNLLWF